MGVELPGKDEMSAARVGCMPRRARWRDHRLLPPPIRTPSGAQTVEQRVLRGVHTKRG